MNHQWILTILAIAKIHLEKSQKTFFTRLQRNDRAARFLFYVPSAVNIFFLLFHLRPFIYRVDRPVSSNQIEFLLLFKKCL